VKPAVSVVTPVHKTSAPYLGDAYESLKAQTFEHGEWVLVLNGGGYVTDDIRNDQRVVVITVTDDAGEQHNRIGRLKKAGIRVAIGPILVELDADDLLTPDALEAILATFEDSTVKMAYSNVAMFEDQTWQPRAFSEYWGWRNRPFTYQGHQLIESIAWPVSAQMMRRVEWAPNHVRAWEATAYWKLGGHDESMKSGDDHDLCCRFYLAYGPGVRHIDRCLYLYRYHANNTCVTHNADVQAQVLQNYLKYSRDLAVRWADDNQLRKIDLGGRFDAWQGFETVDRLDADIITDLNERWPFHDNSVGVIKASHVFEHLVDSVRTMNEAYRVLAPGGWLFIEVPSTDGRGAFQDPTHRSWWNENSFRYYTNQAWARYIQPEYTGRFQASRIVTYDPFNDPTVPVVQADLIALKAPYDERPVGEILI